MRAYQRLEDHQRQLFDLEHVAAIASWDEDTMMPRGGGDSRAEALGTLAELRHQRACDPALGELIERAAEEELDDWQRRNLELIRRSWARATAVPTELVGALERTRTRTNQAWREHRARNAWAAFLPFLEELVAREREAAAVLGATLACDPYDAMIDNWDPGLRQAVIDPIFAELETFLPGFIERALEASARRPVIDPQGPFDVTSQRKLGLAVMGAIGFDFEHGRLDVSQHPSCGGVPRDVRVTTRYDAGNFTSSLMAIVHETGHAKYDQGLPEPWLTQPVGAALGMALHESQSLLFEMQIGRSREFLEFLAPRIADVFVDQAAARPDAFTVENLHALYTRVERSLIRVDADEATYPTHILLRYELERDLFRGGLEVADIPERWDLGMDRLLGVDTRGNFRDGCMQDIHWAAGLFGYFPSYTLGAMAAAQLFAAIRRDVADAGERIAAGDFGPITQWLSERVWGLGSRHDLDGVLQHATGEPLDARYYRQHLERRYLGAVD